MRLVRICITGLITIDYTRGSDPSSADSGGDDSVNGVSASIVSLTGPGEASPGSASSFNERPDRQLDVVEGLCLRRAFASFRVLNSDMRRTAQTLANDACD